MDDHGEKPRKVNWMSLVCLGILAAVATAGALVIYDFRVKDETLQQNIGGLNSQITDLNKKYDSELNKYQYVSSKGVVITVYSPTRNEKVSSPLTVVGKVPGNWSFEANFPVKLTSTNGEVVASAPATLLGNWMVDTPVLFTVRLEWSSQQSGAGSLILSKDNPSGLPENDDSLTIPVIF